MSCNCGKPSRDPVYVVMASDYDWWQTVCWVESRAEAEAIVAALETHPHEPWEYIPSTYSVEEVVPHASQFKDGGDHDLSVR